MRGRAKAGIREASGLRPRRDPPPLRRASPPGPSVAGQPLRASAGLVQEQQAILRAPRVTGGQGWHRPALSFGEPFLTHQSVINLTGLPLSAETLERARAEFDLAQDVAKIFPPPSGEYLAYLKRHHDTLQEITKSSQLYDHLTRARAL